MPSSHAGILYRSPDVTIGDWDCRPSGPGRSAEERVADTQLVLTRRGAFVRHVRGDDVVADPGQVLFFNRGETHRVSHPVEGGDRCTTIALAPERLREALRRHRPAMAEREPRFEPTHGSIESDVHLGHRRLIAWLGLGAPPDLAVDEAAFDLVDAVLAQAYGRPARCAVRPATRRAHREAVAAARLMLSARRAERLTLGQVARAVHTSPYHLSRLFRRETGVSVYRYLQRLRLRHALEALADPGLTLTEVALEAGFYDHSHLTDAFRREFGVAPSRLRRAGDAVRLDAASRSGGA